VEALAPATTEEFLQNTLGRTYKYFPGEPGKFAALLTWPDLNRILASHQLDAPRLRLAQDGKTLSPESFIGYQESRRRGSAPMTRIRPAEFTKHLQDGATLILDAIDEIHEPITILAADLERVLRARVQVNLYAGWRTSPGFDVHWDGHDVLILQVSGRKHWKVYPMTREHPLPDDPKTDEAKTKVAPREPLWEGMLEDGDFLYIPRGWWHVAIPVDEPTLHLTVGLHHATGLDFAAWFVDRLRESAAVRQDLPRLGTAADREAHLQRIRDAWEQAWHPRLLEEYCTYLDSRAYARPHFGLPWTAESDVLPREGDWGIKWLVPRPIDSDFRGGDAIVVRGNGKETMIAAAAWPVLEALEETGMCSIDDLYKRTAGTLEPERLRIFIKELVNAGLASIVVNGAARSTHSGANIASLGKSSPVRHLSPLPQRQH
jgi:hypothetical protein